MCPRSNIKQTVLSLLTRQKENSHISVFFFPPKRQQKEDSFVPVLAGPLKKRRHEGQYLVGGQRQRDVPVLFQTQGGAGTSLGNPERESQKDDLSEDGACAAQLRQNRRGEEDQEEVDVPVQ